MAGRRRRDGAVAGGALLLAGSALLRWAVFKAGFVSARDPRYTVGPQRERLAARAGAGDPVLTGTRRRTTCLRYPCRTRSAPV